MWHFFIALSYFFEFFDSSLSTIYCHITNAAIGYEIKEASMSGSQI